MISPTVSSAKAPSAKVVVRLKKRSAAGRVVVRDGSSTLYTKRVQGGRRFKLTLTLPALSPGTHRLRAVYRGRSPRIRVKSTVVEVRAVEVQAVKGCAPQPSICGYPDSSNTGPVAGTTFRAVPGDVSSGPGWRYDPRGWIDVSGDGAVLSGLSTSVPFDVNASNVTIENNRITVSGEGWGVALRTGTGITIANNEISSPDALGSGRLLVGIKDIYGTVSGVQVLRNDIWHTSTGIQLDEGLVADNFVHDAGFKDGDHTNGIMSNGGSSRLVIRHNTVFNELDQTDAIALFQDFGPQTNRLIENNLIAGGGYTLYAGANPGKESTATNIAVVGNVFARTIHPRGGYYGPATAYTPGGGNSWTGNVWDDTGQPVGY